MAGGKSWVGSGWGELWAHQKEPRTGRDICHTMGSSMAGVTHRHRDCGTAMHTQANCHNSIVVTSMQTHTKRVHHRTNSHSHVKVTLPCKRTYMHIPTQSCTYMHAPLHDTHAALYVLVPVVRLCTHTGVGACPCRDLHSPPRIGGTAAGAYAGAHGCRKDPA